MADRASNDMPIRAFAGLLLGQHASRDLLGYKRVIVRDLADLAIAYQIRATVACIRQHDGVITEERANASRSHFAAALLENHTIRFFKSGAERDIGRLIDGGIKAIDDGLH